MKRKWKYLTTLYGSVICINMLFVFVIFPSAVMQANINPTAAFAGSATLTLDVAIPCPGHAPLITNALKNTSGVMAVSYQPPGRFKVGYDTMLTSKEEILALNVFKYYSADVVR